MRWRSIWGMVLAAAVLLPPGIAAQDSRPGIAVLPFANGGSYGQDREDFEALEVGLQQMLMTELAVGDQLRIVERSRLRQLVEEQDLGASGRVDANTAARLGRLVAARYMVLGGFTDLYGDFRIDARVVSVETGEIVKTERVRNKREQIYDLVVDLAGQVRDGLDLPQLSGQAMQQLEQQFEGRQQREVPQEAVRLYVKGLLYQDRGDSERAAELFRQAVSEYPEYTEAHEALRQVGSS